MNRIITSLLIFLSLTSAVLSADSWIESMDIDVNGFLDIRSGFRTQNDSNEKDASLGEARIQISLERNWDIITIQLRSDFLYDHIPDDHSSDLEEGSGVVDLREANLQAVPADFMDIKIGRQILTWGTGDMLFINDLFPKDWQSFFSGRDDEYLKAPSDAVFTSFFPELANIDIVYTPRFNPDRGITGERLSYWNPMLGSLAGQNAIADPDKPDDWFNDHEVAGRVSKTIAGYDLAAYAYDGYWKNPKGMNPATTNAIFPGLSVYGASIDGNLGKGLFNIETGYYKSKDDSKGSDPFIPNDEIRLLLGYEMELLRDLSVAVQYYVEHLQGYSNYTVNLPVGMNARDEDRQLATIRLTKMAMSQNLTLSLFAYYSPTDKDGYIRPVIKFKQSDNLQLTAGANIFIGKEDHTFFGQFENNSNIYAGIRRSF